MNILIYVVTLLSIILALTAAKVNLFERTEKLKPIITLYMETVERLPYQQLAEADYKRISLGSKSSSDKPPTDKLTSTSRLNIDPILISELRQSPEYQPTRHALKQLMLTLYQHTNFYQRLSQRNPRFLDDLLNDIERAMDLQKIKIERVAQLSQLDLDDPDLDYAFQLMLQGIPIPLKRPQMARLDPKAISEDNLQEETEITEDEAQPGYIALQNFLTVKRGRSSKVRVALAPKELLQAIFGSPQLVQEIDLTRRELLNEIKRNPNSKEQVSKEFEEKFGSQAPQFAEILDFRLANTTATQQVN